MAKGKLILICQYGGEFTTTGDGSLEYNGGEANALHVNCDTLFEDLKLKLAEVCNFELNSMSIKYFLPGNRRTPITLSNDRDLKRMLSFHEKSVTADVFLSGSEGFDHNALELDVHGGNGVKLADTVNHGSASAAVPRSFDVESSSAAILASPVTVVHSATPGKSFNTGGAAASAVPMTALATNSLHSSSDVVDPFDANPKNCTRIAFVSDPSHAPGEPYGLGTVPQSPDSAGVVANATGHNSTLVDISPCPADTVKKRRRTAAWKAASRGPIIVAVTDDVVEKSNGSSWKKNRSSAAIGSVGQDDQRKSSDCRDDDDCCHKPSVVDDISPENSVASWRDELIGIGQDFKSVYEFRDALQKYSIAHRFAYRLRKNDTARVSGRCAAEGCSWKIHASWIPTAHSFRIKKMVKAHTCEGKSWELAHPSKSWLVSVIEEILQDIPHCKPKDIINSIARDFGIQLNYSQVWRGIEDAKIQLLGSQKEAYDQLPWFCEKVVEVNLGTMVKLVTRDDKTFERLFVCFHASIHGFKNGSRPVLFLDSTLLRSKYHESLLVATGFDGNDGFFPVAMAIVDNENDDSWLWFLEQLKVPMSVSQVITFISDREKGLKKFVVEVFENSHHGYSLYHLIESFKKNLKGPFYGDGKGSLVGSLLAAAQATHFDGFKISMEQIKQVSPDTYDWLQQIEPEYWTSALFKGEQYNQIAENSIESLTKLLEEVRELPIMQKIAAVMQMMIELINTRQRESSKWSSKLTPSKEERLRAEIQKTGKLQVLFSSDSLFEVRDDSINVVNVETKECTCRVWKATGVPCCHAVAVFNSTGRSAYDYCSRYFSVDNFRLTYAEPINPVPKRSDSQEGTSSDDVRVLPPRISRPLAQQKVIKTKPQRPGKRVVCCTKCKQAGHNKATCTLAS
ncbi:hypothetical protein Ancab_040041 [Ancistrocladus abbreviatus]